MILQSSLLFQKSTKIWKKFVEKCLVKKLINVILYVYYVSPGNELFKKKLICTFFTHEKRHQINFAHQNFIIKNSYCMLKF